jgi:PKD repeat protein
VTLWLIFVSISGVRGQNGTVYTGGNNLTRIVILPNSNLYINGTLFNNIPNEFINIHNGGNITLKGSLISNQKGLFYSSSNAISGNKIDTIKAKSAQSLAPIGKVVFAGTGTQEISGNQRILFDNIDVSNSIMVNQSIHVYGNINLIKGNVNLGSNNIFLFDTASPSEGIQFKGNIKGESYASRIYGTSGKLMAYKDINPMDTNAIGIHLVGGKLGYTQINRSHVSITNVSDTSILKYFDIIPVQQAPVTVTIEYLDNDLLPRMIEDSLKVWRQTGTNQRFNKVKSTAYPSLNKVKTITNLTFEKNLKTRLTVASGNCKNPPKFDLGNVTAICNHDTIIKKVKLVNFDKARAPYYYLWNTGLMDTLDNIKIAVKGTYKVTVTDSRGCEATDSVKVTVNARPHLKNFRHSDKLCIGYEINFNTRFDTILQDTAKFKYLWNFGNGLTDTLKNPTTIYNTYETTNVRQIVTASNGCDTSINQQITINKLPDPAFNIINLGSNLMQFENVTPDKLAEIKWRLYDSVFNLIDTKDTICPLCKNYRIAISPGTYSMKLITEATAGHCVDSISQTFKMRNAYVSFHPSHTSICAGDTEIFQNQSVITDSTGNVIYQWDFGDDSQPFIDPSFSSPIHIYSKAGNYLVSLSVMNTKSGWTLSHTDSIDVNGKPRIDFKDTISTCNSYIDLAPSCKNGVTYNWSNGAAVSFIRVNSGGFYAVTVTDQNQCVNHDGTFVMLNSIVKPRLGPDTVTCSSYVFNAGYDGGKYEWTEYSHPANILSVNQLFTVTQSGLYAVKVTDVYGCIGTSQVNVNVKSAVNVDLGDDIKVCEGVSSVLDASKNQPARASYAWSGPGNLNGYSQSALHVNQTGLYKVTVTDPVSNCRTSDSVIVAMYPNPKFTLGPDNYICNKSRLTLSTGLYWSGLTTTWGSNNGYIAQTVDVGVDKPGKYWAQVVNTMGCLSSDTIALTEKGLNIIPEYLVASDAYTYDTIQFIQIAQPEIIHYTWYFGDGATDSLKNPRHIYSFPDSFQVKLEVFDGYCSASITKGLKVQPEYLKKRLIPDTDQKVKLNMIESAKAYPNPSDGIVNFEIKMSSPGDFMVYLFSLKGSLIDVVKVSNQDNYSRVYNLQGLSAGIYILKVITQNDSKAFKLIIQ